MQAYQNLSLSKKIFISLMIIAALGMAIGAVGINGMSRLSEEDKEMYEFNTLPMKYLATMYDTLASQRISANNMVIFRESDPQFADDENQAINEKEALYDEALKAYSEVLSNEKEEQLYRKIDQLYNNEFKAIKSNLRAVVASGDEQAMGKAIFEMDSMGAEISGYMDEAFALNDKLASDKVRANQELHQSRTVLLIASMATGALFTVLFSITLGGMMSRPINRIKNATRQVAETGNLSFSEEAMRAIRQDAQYADETGQMSKAFVAMMSALIEKTNILETLASGDFTPKVPLAGKNDTMGNALERMVSSLNGSFGQINSASLQVSTGSKQIASGAQALAQGATEQASAIQQLSSSISEIADKTRHNAGIAKEATELSNTIRGNAEKGSLQMSQMMQAVQEITEASNQIGKVIKVIDNIAFQTNILALNASVEAARAGQHGSGFAVVAEEVRNLAAKSADAAKDTGELIENSIEKAAFGLGIASETSASLREIVEGINRSAAIVAQIARSSDEQASAIAQINVGIDQVAQVVQQNSATSQQSAAASEEMSGQSDMLEQLVSHFKLKDSALPASYGAPGGQRTLAAASTSEYAVRGQAENYGKY